MTRYLQLLDYIPCPLFPFQPTTLSPDFRADMDRTINDEYHYQLLNQFLPPRAYDQINKSAASKISRQYEQFP